MIRSNAHRYSISALCKCLGIARSTYYYEARQPVDERELETKINEVFYQNRGVYGSRKIQKALAKQSCRISRRRICRLMHKLGLESAYAKSKYRTHGKSCNEADIPNELNRQFDGQKQYGVVVSDLTYVRVNYKWNYVCILLDLFNRQIIGYSAGVHKNAKLVYNAFATVETDLRNIKMFHTDRGSEFNSSLIDDVIATFDIKRSLSLKGCPYDNAVAESTFKIFKTEFVHGRNFANLDSLKLELSDYVHWFNQFRLHSSLGYLSPLDFKAYTLTNLSD